VSQILLACGASAALHKACDLASHLAQQGHRVRSVLTPRAAELVRPQLFEALTGEPAFASEWGDARRAGMDHIDLARWAEIFLVAPPRARRYVCPAMNPHMLAAAPVARNLEQLRRDGWQVIEPGAGRLACGDEGRGRLAEPEEIAAFLARAQPG